MTKARTVFRSANLLRVLGLALAIGAATPAAAEPVIGAGSTFAAPVFGAWSQDYLRDLIGSGDFVGAGRGVDYEPVGSLAGVGRLGQPETDFAATDSPLSPGVLEQQQLAQFPVVIGGLALAVNLEGVADGELKLSGPLVADIYLGKVTRWNDAALLAENPGLALPDLAITPVHRIDGSGSTDTFSRFLAGASTAWAEGPGTGTELVWPTGAAAAIAADGSSALAAAVAATPGAIGYLEAGQAARAGLAAAAIRNRAGFHVAPSPEAFARTAEDFAWDASKGFFAVLTDADTPDAYPLVAATFVLMHREDRSPARTRHALRFFAFALTEGDDTAADLGYVALPDGLAREVFAYWKAALPGAPDMTPGRFDSLFISYPAAN
jgi:phosphate transport system substrate-binding protein